MKQIQINQPIKANLVTNANLRKWNKITVTENKLWLIMCSKSTAKIFFFFFTPKEASF
jgi:hypothetical protein